MRRHWATLLRIDHFRREGVRNQLRDLRSPLTATAACLQAFKSRWAGAGARTADRDLVVMALRKPRIAAWLVQSLGDLAQLRELAFKLRSEVLDAGEALGDIASLFCQRAANQGSSLQTPHPLARVLAPFAALDIALFERAVAKLVRDALKFRRPGDANALTALRDGDCVGGSVSHPGLGIDAVDLSPLFDRFSQSRQNVAPATGEGGNGLAPAIVKRMPNFTAGRSPSPVRRAPAPV